jgi:hypothetical protein
MSMVLCNQSEIEEEGLVLMERKYGPRRRGNVKMGHSITPGHLFRSFLELHQVKLLVKMTTENRAVLRGKISAKRYLFSSWNYY